MSSITFGRATVTINGTEVGLATAFSVTYAEDSTLKEIDIKGEFPGVGTAPFLRAGGDWSTGVSFVNTDSTAPPNIYINPGPVVREELTERLREEMERSMTPFLLRSRSVYELASVPPREPREVNAPVKDPDAKPRYRFVEKPAGR